MEKKITINIDKKDFVTLKKNKYKLCFAKSIEGKKFNTVWKTLDINEYFINTEFKWTPEYSICASSSFANNQQVNEMTGSQKIELGQQITLDKNGLLCEPETGSFEESILFINEYSGTTHPVIKQVNSDSKVESSIYIAENAVIIGTDIFTPVDKILVWFQQDVETNTMFSEAKSNSIIINLTFANERKALFKDQNWAETVDSDK